MRRKLGGGIGESYEYRGKSKEGGGSVENLGEIGGKSGGENRGGNRGGNREKIGGKSGENLLKIKKKSKKSRKKFQILARIFCIFS